MSVIKCDCVNDVSGNEQQQKTINSVTNQIHKSQLRLKSIQILTEVMTFITDVRQVNEQHNNDNNQNNIIC